MTSPRGSHRRVEGWRRGHALCHDLRKQVQRGPPAPSPFMARDGRVEDHDVLRDVPLEISSSKRTNINCTAIHTYKYIIIICLHIIYNTYSHRMLESTAKSPKGCLEILQRLRRAAGRALWKRLSSRSCWARGHSCAFPHSAMLLGKAFLSVKCESFGDEVL